MNRTMLKILIATLILLIGAGAVSAIDNNSTDEVVSVEQTEEISVIEDNEVISVNESNNEVLSVENNDTVISVSGNDSEVLTADNNNNTVISVSENNSDVLSVENTNSVISVSSDDNLTASSPFAKDPQMTQSKTQYKTLYVGKMKLLKKYRKMALYGYKTPSKKNKKAWRMHIGFQKAAKKQLKLLTNKAYKVGKKAKANHWYPIGDPYYKIRYSGNYMHVYYYLKCYRTYNYNPLLNKGWWD